jgi:hypothetical protein
VEWDLHLNSVAQREREFIHQIINWGLCWERRSIPLVLTRFWAGKLELWSLFLCPWEDDMRTGRKEFLVKGHLFFTWFLVALVVVAICN